MKQQFFLYVDSETPLNTSCFTAVNVQNQGHVAVFQDCQGHGGVYESLRHSRNI